MSFLLRVILLLTLVLLLNLQGCASTALSLVSYPTLNRPEDNKKTTIYKLNDLNWILNQGDLEVSVDVDNFAILESKTEILTVPIKKNGLRTPNVGNNPFIITLGVRAKHGRYSVITANAILYLENGNIELKPIAVYMADKDRELDCLLYKKNNLNIPLAESEIRVPNRNNSVDASNPQNWKCIKYVFDILTPDPTVNFSLLAGTVTEKGVGLRDNLRIYFSPRRYKSKRTN